MMEMDHVAAQHEPVAASLMQDLWPQFVVGSFLLFSVQILISTFGASFTGQKNKSNLKESKWVYRSASDLTLEKQLL